MAGPSPAMNDGYRSAAGGAFGIDVDRVERLARRHEQPVAAASAKAQIGAALRQCDAADHLAVGREHRDPVEFAWAPAAPQIAGDIAAKAVRRAVADIAEDPPVGEPGSVLDNVVDADRARL